MTPLYAQAEMEAFVAAAILEILVASQNLRKGKTSTSIISILQSRLVFFTTFAALLSYK